MGKQHQRTPPEGLTLVQLSSFMLSVAVAHVPKLWGTILLLVSPGSIPCSLHTILLGEELFLHMDSAGRARERTRQSFGPAALS